MAYKAEIDAETQEWRQRVLEEATRIRTALKDVQQRRKEAREEAERVLATPRPDGDTSGALSGDIADEMQKLEAAQASLTRNNTRLARLTSGLADYESMDEAAALQEKAAQAQLEQLQMAQAEMEKTNKRLAELNAEADAEEDEGESADAPDAPKAPGLLVPKLPTLQKTESMQKEDVDRWENMKQQESTRITPRSLDGSAMTPRSSAASKDFIKAETKDLGPSFDTIKREMQLTSSPLVFFNLACFQGQRNADMDVMHPICGFAVAGRVLSVMGPPGTDTSTLRDALTDHHSENASSSVIVADFTVKALIEVADAILRPETMRPNEDLLEFLKLSAVAGIKVGTCIQRNQADGSTLGTPRGSRNPEAPTPRNPNTPRLSGSKAAIQKSVLLMDDLLEILDAESVFRLLRVLRKIAINKRASVIVTVGADFGRRGLLNLFDDTLYFTQDGVSFFGPSHRMPDFCALVGSPVPEGTYPTDHIQTISNVAAKYDECPIKKLVDAVILEYTGTSEKVDDPSEEVPKISRKKSALVPRFMRKKKAKNQIDMPDVLDSSVGAGMSARARRLAIKLAAERKQLAVAEKADQKLEVWNRLAELDRHIARGAGHSEHVKFVTFEQMLAHMERDAKRQRPSCFMNLACFLNSADQLSEAIAKPTCAYANEGRVLGVMGPGSADPENLLNSLKISSEAFTTVTDMTVKSALKLSEFLKNRDKADPEAGLDDNVGTIMAKMMLTASSDELIGTLIQRASGPVAANTQVMIGDQILSTAVRSILVLDKILELDAQSLFVVLKLIKRIAVQARLAVVLMLSTREECKGLYPLLDNILCFNKEGVGYFGPSEYLANYCELVEIPVRGKMHVAEHFMEVMDSKLPSKYVMDSLDTPFTIRYQSSPLYTFNKSVFEISATPQAEGGNRTARMMVPKSFRKKPVKASPEVIAMEQAEVARQKKMKQGLAKREEEERRSTQTQAFEEMWKKLIASEKQVQTAPVAAGFDSILAQINKTDKPSLFFNLACFLPADTTDRIDILQPICGYALIGNIVAIMGPPSTDPQIFIDVLCAAQPYQEGQMGPPAAKNAPIDKAMTLLDLMEIAESTRPDRGSRPLHDSANTLMKNLGLAQFAAAKIGTIIQRQPANELEVPSKKVASILILHKMSDCLDPQAIFVVIKLVKRIALQASLAVVLYLDKAIERHGLFNLVNDAFLFDATGVTYFGPAKCLRDYMALIGFPCPSDGIHLVDHLTELSAMYQRLPGAGSGGGVVGRRRSFFEGEAVRGPTDTSPTVRYKHSPLAKHVLEVTGKFTRPAENDFDLESYRSGSETARSRRPSMMFIPRGTRAKRRGSTAEMQERINREEAVIAQEKLAEQEAEAERMRQYEQEAEVVWQKLMDHQ